MANSNGKSKSWMYRLKNLRIRRRSVDSTINEDSTVMYQRNLSGYETNTNCSRTRNNFRKSLRKMQTRVKNVFNHRNTSPSSRHTIHISSGPTSSHSQSRITLNSTAIHQENIYTFDPIKKVTGPVEDTVFDVHSRLSDIPMQLGGTSSSNPAEDTEIPSRNPSKRNFPQLSEIQNGRVPKNEVVSLSSCYWYWGPISRTHAEERLRGFPDGAFLIRDSSSDRYIFTLSFRSVGKTLHTRIELSKSGYSLFGQGGYHSIAELVNDALTKSKNGIYCYTKSRDEINPNYPVRFTLPVSRYDKVPSLKHLSRFVIRQCININDVERLPLPLSLIGYLQEDGSYF